VRGTPVQESGQHKAVILAAIARKEDEVLPTPETETPTHILEKNMDGRIGSWTAHTSI